MKDGLQFQGSPNAMADFLRHCLSKKSENYIRRLLIIATSGLLSVAPAALFKGRHFEPDIIVLVWFISSSIL